MSGDDVQPPLPAPAASARRDPGSRARAARGLGTDALGFFPPEAFERDAVFRRLFGRRQVILNRAEAIHRVLVENPGNYGRTAATIRILRPLLGDGLLLSEGESWRQQRHILAPAFAPRTIPALARHVGAASESALGRLAAAGGRPVDLLAAMQSLTLAVAGRALFSLEMARFEPELRDLVNRYAERLGRPSLLDFLLPLWLPSPRDLARRPFRRRWRQLIGRIIAARQAKEGEAPSDLFDLLAGAGAAGDALADRMATLLVAGHETTAVALFWSLLLVAEAPEVQAGIAAEASALDLGPDGAAAALPALVYTRAAVQEAIRLYPPAFTLARLARGPDVAGGIAIPAGAVVLIAPWVLHRHRRLWRAPERFDPARFLPGAPAPDRFSYMPFGIGPRTCIGAQFALTEASLVLARIVQAFEVERADEGPVKPVGIVTTQPERRPPFRLRRRAGRLSA